MRYLPFLQKMTKYRSYIVCVAVSLLSLCACASTPSSQTSESLVLVTPVMAQTAINRDVIVLPTPMVLPSASPMPATTVPSTALADKSASDTMAAVQSQPQVAQSQMAERHVPPRAHAQHKLPPPRRAQLPPNCRRPPLRLLKAPMCRPPSLRSNNACWNWSIWIGAMLV